MNVLFLTPALPGTSPGQRFRVEQWARYLREDGTHCTFAPFEDPALHEVLYAPGQLTRKAARMLWAYTRRVRTVAAARGFDVVVIHREAALIGPAVVERCIKRLGVPIVYDFDDPIWLRYRSPSNNLFSRLKCQGKTRSICRLASRVITGNRLLAEWARQYAAQVDVVPSTIDMQQYPARPKANSNKESSPRTLAWTGSHSTLPFLETLRPALRRLAQHEIYRLLVISHTDRYRMQDVPVETASRRWRAETEAEDLHAADIGLGPFPSEGWTPWRCHGKVLQYMAVGMPCVVSNIGILPDYIQDGVNGFLAGSEEEWVAKLLRLMRDPALRVQMGQAARKTIQEKYSAEVWAPKVKQILQEAAASGAPRRRRRQPPLQKLEETAECVSR